MIAPLRKRHRVMISVLAFVVPAVCALALWSRPRLNVGETPGTVLPQAVVGAEDLEVLPGFRTAVHGEPGSARLEIEPLSALRQPDLLVYFTTATPADSLPDDAHLLGAVAHQQPRSFALPAAAAEGGYLVLYSLAHQTVVLSGALAPVALAAAAANPAHAPHGDMTTGGMNTGDMGTGDAASAVDGGGSQ